ncbi:M12 family metallopeptidase [Chitinimonas lacunae]|uniref:M12 family metallopeptidase n=1 Tax=Chitinimonas lacunae TaxID=1963018 RepID=A0ABV8MS06_9NEIS
MTRFKLQLAVAAAFAALSAPLALADELASAKVQGSNETMTYRVVDGYALLGDIVLGRHEDIQREGIRPLGVKSWTDEMTEGGNRFSDNHYRSARIWPNNVLYYTFDASLTQQGRNAALAAMQHISSKTAVRFQQRTNEPNFVRIFRGGGCYSMAGMIGGQQDLSLGSGCEYTGIAVHEFMHALGWMHEHMRPDRDNFVQIRWENISAGSESQYTKLASSQVDLVGSYDYSSIMHYDTYGFTKNGQPTIVPLQSGVKIGQRDGLSQGDVNSVNRFYPGTTTGGTTLSLAVSTKQLSLSQNASGNVTIDVTSSDPANVSLNASTSNSSVVALSGLSWVRTSNNQFSMKVVPVSNGSGSTTITVTATEKSGKTATTSFVVNVAAAPTSGALEQKANKLLDCIEKILPSYLPHTTTTKQPVGTNMFAYTRYYTTKWATAVVEPAPGKVWILMPHDQQNWVHLGDMETLNKTYCNAW